MGWSRKIVCAMAVLLMAGCTQSSKGKADERDKFRATELRLPLTSAGYEAYLDKGSRIYQVGCTIFSVPNEWAWTWEPNAAGSTVLIRHRFSSVRIDPVPAYRDPSSVVYKVARGRWLEFLLPAVAAGDAPRLSVAYQLRAPLRLWIIDRRAEDVCATIRSEQVTPADWRRGETQLSGNRGHRYLYPDIEVRYQWANGSLPTHHLSGTASQEPWRSLDEDVGRLIEVLTTPSG